MRVSAFPASRRVPLAFCALAAVLAGAGLIFREAGLVLFAVLPLAVGGALLLGRERPFAGRFTEQALELADPARSIRYDSIVDVQPVGPLALARPDSFEIELTHRAGRLRIPARLTVSSARVLDFLSEFAPAARSRLPPQLADYLAQQELSFGANRVWCTASRRRSGARWDRRVVAAGAGVALAGVVWVVAGLWRSLEWKYFGGAAIAVGGVVAAAGAAQAATRAPKGPAGGIVIDPLGLAVQQGDLSGHLTWQEIREVTLRERAGHFGAPGASRPPGIHLRVEGATICLVDAYDRPLSEIHQRIVRNWR